MTPKPPTVSVILPFFNQEAYVAAAIESVLRQSFTCFELLVIDDGSTDKSAAIIREYAQKDHRIRAFFEPNRGKCGAINFLLTHARGRYYAFMDGDDYMELSRLAEQVAALEANPELSGVSCHCHYIDAKGIRMGKQRYPHLSSIAANEQARQSGAVVLFAFTGLTMRQGVLESVGGLDHRFWPCEDLELANRLLDGGHNVVILNKCLMNYRIHKASVTGSQWWWMRRKSRWTYAHIEAIRKGGTTIPFVYFEQGKSSNCLLQNLSFYQSGYAVLHQRQALFALFKKRVLAFLFHGALAFLMQPKFVFAVVKGRFVLFNLFTKKQVLRIVN